MCRADDIERATIWDENERTAAVEHKCCECYRIIRVGERYRDLRTLHEGRWSRDRTCRHCLAASGWLVAMCGAYVLREVYEELEEHWNEGYKSVPFARLIAGMRRKWHGGRDPVPTGMREMAESMMQRAVR